MDGYLDGSTEGFAGRLEVIEGRTGRRVRSPEGQNPARDPRRPSNERYRRLHALEVPEDVNPCRIGKREGAYVRSISNKVEQQRPAAALGRVVMRGLVGKWLRGSAYWNEAIEESELAVRL
jgi:hypothetical protein